MPIDTGPQKGMLGRIRQGALQGLRRNPSLGGMAGGAIGGMFRPNPVMPPNPMIPPSPNPMGTPSFQQPPSIPSNPMMGGIGQTNPMMGMDGISPMWQNYNRMRQPPMMY